MKSRKAVLKMPLADASSQSLAPLVEELIKGLGEDTGREGLQQTPQRVEKALRFLTSGYRADIRKIVNGALFEVKYDEMVIVKDIEMFSMCEHHMLIGLSKIPRIVDAFARRLQIQERLTQQVAETIQQTIDPIGVGVICEARHFCMMMRGVEKQHSGAVTSAMLGAFRNRKETRDEFLSLVRQRTAS